MSKVLKWVGSKALDGVKATGSAIGKEIDKSMEESKRKRMIYKDAYQQALKEERENLKHIQDEALRKKAREDAKRKVRGVKKDA